MRRLVLGFGTALAVAGATALMLRSLREPYALWIPVVLAIGCCAGVVALVVQARTPLLGRIVFAAGYIAAMIGFVAAWFMRRAGHVEMGARTATTVAYVVTALGVLAFAFARSARR